MRDRHDHYFRKARAEGYLSRAAYKLMEIDDRRKILHRGDWVLDCGCWPGGWLQVAANRVGPGGAVIGVDLEPIRHQFPHANVRTVEADLRSVDANDLLRLAAEASGGGGDSKGQRRFDVILSDMAPKTSGDHTIDHHASARLCDLVLSLCPGLLRPGGSLVMKLFEGERYPDLLAQCRAFFKSVKGFKPKSSRSESREMYIIAQEYAGSVDSGDGSSAGSALPPPPKPRPRPGW